MNNLVKKSLVFFFFFTSSSAFSKIYIYKQWHFLPSIDTTKVEDPDKFPQYINQHDIYEKITKLIQTKGSIVLIVEGCEGEVAKNFSKTYNGWNIKKLKNRVKDSEYEKIMTHIGLKVEAKFPKKSLTVCGDNEKLVEKNQLLFSDLRAYIGYYSRLKEFKGKNSQKFKTYSEAMLKGQKVKDPVLYAKNKAKETLRKVQAMIHQRNDSFLEVIKLHKKEKTVVVVIGGLHVEDLKKKVDELGFESKVITPKGYPESDMSLIKQLESSLN